VVKSFLTEITDDTNRSNAFYLFSLSWAVGSVIAPLLGGLLCKPAEKYPSVFSDAEGSVWVEFPYLLPCLCVTLINVSTSILCMCCLWESLGGQHKRHAEELLARKMTKRGGWLPLLEFDSSRRAYHGGATSTSLLRKSNVHGNYVKMDDGEKDNRKPNRVLDMEEKMETHTPLQATFVDADASQKRFGNACAIDHLNVHVHCNDGNNKNDLTTEQEEDDPVCWPALFNLVDDFYNYIGCYGNACSICTSDGSSTAGSKQYQNTVISTYTSYKSVNYGIEEDIPLMYPAQSCNLEDACVMGARRLSFQDVPVPVLRRSVHAASSELIRRVGSSRASNTSIKITGFSTGAGAGLASVGGISTGSVEQGIEAGTNGTYLVQRYVPLLTLHEKESEEADSNRSSNYGSTPGTGSINAENLSTTAGSVENATVDHISHSLFEPQYLDEESPPPGSGPSSTNRDRGPAILTKRTVVMATVCYGLACACNILVDEVIPLFLKLDGNKGGFGFSTTEIGILLSSGAVGMMVLTVVCMPYTAGVSNLKMTKWTLVATVPFIMAYPLLALFNSQVLSSVHNYAGHLLLLWPALILVTMCRNFITALTFTAAIVMVNNSVEDKHLGKVNGLGQSLGSLARSLGPALGGVIWSIGTISNFVYLNFIVIFMTYAVNYYVTSLLPKSLDVKKGQGKRT
jgi:hypothetical protein